MQKMKTLEYNTIILIDDDPIANMITTRLIEKTVSVKVMAYTKAEDALLLLRLDKSAPTKDRRLIFLDINMPIMDGWQFLDEFQKLQAKIRQRCTIVMLTSSIDLDDLQKSKTYKCVRDFISKPLTQHKLASLLN